MNISIKNCNNDKFKKVFSYLLHSFELCFFELWLFGLWNSAMVTLTQLFDSNFKDCYFLNSIDHHQQFSEHIHYRIF